MVKACFLVQAEQADGFSQLVASYKGVKGHAAVHARKVLDDFVNGG